MGKVILEVCVDTPGGAVISKDLGAGRIELCSSLEIGGLTPSFGLVKNTVFSDLPVFAMIRPRGGDFIYSEPEIRCMLTDIECLQDSGIAGFVFGALDSRNNLDERLLEKLISACSDLPTTLNRAFDLSSDPMHSLEVAVQLGFDRILSSGASASVSTGLPLLTKMFAKAKDRIIIVPGGGVTPESIDFLLDNLPIREIHASCKKIVAAMHKDNPDVNIGRNDRQERFRTDPEILKKLLNIINSRNGIVA